MHTKTGLTIINSNFAIELRLGTKWYGWLFKQHHDGQYVSVKKLNDIEILDIKSCFDDNWCVWTNSNGTTVFDDESQWSTQCGSEFMLIDGTLEDNEMKYCCYCGRTIKHKGKSCD